MDTNLDDSLNLDSAMQVDFEQPEETVCHQDDIILDQEDIPMEFVYEEKQMLMDTTGEEIIISDFIGGQFNLQDLQNDQSELANLTQVQGNYNLRTQSDTMLDLQLNQPIFTTLPEQLQKNIVITTVQSSPRKKVEALPKPVAIAPKTAMVKPVNIVPKPVTLVQNKNVMNKTQTIGTLPSSAKGTFLAQIGKQILMMPSNTQKIKLISASQANASQVQFLPKSTVTSQGKPMKIITLPASQTKLESKQTVITKVMPSNTNVQPQTRYVTIKPNSGVPVSVRNKVIMVSPNDQGVKLKKKQEIISLQPMAKLLPKVTTAEKVPISALSSSQNVILKTTAPPAQSSKTPAESSRTQIHQINVPGKGIQFIRLVTNSGANKSVVKQPQKIITIPKSSVVTDNRAAELKPPKLVKIAPLKQGRSSQSLLAPLNEPENQQLDDRVVESFVKVEPDSKEELRNLLEKTMSDEASVDFTTKIEEEDSRESSRVEQEHPEHPLIVIPSNFEHTVEVQSDYDKSNESETITAALKDENDSSTNDDVSFSFNEQAIDTTDLGLRPRKACNCTKSQCLKLYCDCFANGEFCNQCNCNNCFNNLENEELRQKAIRGCLDRNPHAFKPKIGKSKVGGPEIVRRHTKGCNCKRSGCLKNYCECYEARIACTAMCKCVGCRNVTDCMEQGRFERVTRPNQTPQAAHLKQPCAFMTSEVIEAVCQCLVAAAEGGEREVAKAEAEADPLRDVIDEFARCLQDIIAAAHSLPMSQEECPT